MNLFNRIHDLYIASPNTTAPGFSHSQGAMYLSRSWHGPARGMDLPTRAAKLGEIWRQLNWLEAELHDTRARQREQAEGVGRRLEVELGVCKLAPGGHVPVSREMTAVPMALVMLSVLRRERVVARHGRAGPLPARGSLQL